MALWNAFSHICFGIWVCFAFSSQNIQNTFIKMSYYEYSDSSHVLRSWPAVYVCMTSFISHLLAIISCPPPAPFRSRNWREGRFATDRLWLILNVTTVQIYSNTHKGAIVLHRINSKCAWLIWPNRVFVDWNKWRISQKWCHHKKGFLPLPPPPQ